MTSIETAPAPRFAVPERLDAAAFAGFDPAAEVIDWSGATMGTHWTVRAAVPLDVDAKAVAPMVQARLDGLVAEMSHWDDDSSLSRFNASPAGSWMILPPDFASVIAASLKIAEQSGGLFDPAVGRLTDLWGLGPRSGAATPSDDHLADAVTASGWRRLVFDPTAKRLRQPGGLRLDLSGSAKGYAADAVADSLADSGLRHALVEVGGECVGRGLRPDRDPWWVELETPADLELAPLRVALHQLAIATSGHYLGAHTVHPATGRIVTDGPVAVSVIHPSCMVADAWASAFMVASCEETRRLAEERALAVRSVDPDGREWISAAFQAMLV